MKQRCYILRGMEAKSNGLSARPETSIIGVHQIHVKDQSKKQQNPTKPARPSY